ncbi:MAG: DUF5018 domain-containing protein [Tannerella sp.]|jgi:hypothetical protein|nr:DUF5018 domain-containing protein [Tannerella sp.]
MKKLNLKLYGMLVAGCLFLLGACNDDAELSNEANIVVSFKVTGASGKVFNSSIEGNAITLKVSPYLDAEEELSAAMPVFYLSRGATVSPDPTVPQDFSQAGGVKYTVTAEDGKTQNTYTVTWGISDQLPYGEGFTYAEIGTKKSFVELGYPGEVGNTGLASIEYGDLLMYHAYCGDYIVLLSRAYINSNPASPHCVKVVDKITLNAAGSLNLGSINISNLKMITSDYKGRCVAAVTDGSQSEFFYWTTPADAPKSIGKISIDVAASTDGSANFQVAGDITANAWITALAPRSPQGEHYRIKVTGGQLASDYSMISSGYSSSDCSGFQMISPLDDSDRPSFAIGDTEGTANAANSIHCYINSPAGSTTNVMPGYWQNILQTWWVGTGFSTIRTGGRSPIVSALPINGKTYVTLTSGTGWWYSAAVVSSDLQSLAHENLNIAYDVAASRGWSYGEWVDWYWDDEAKEAYLAVWFGRLGLYTYKMTCYE